MGVELKELLKVKLYMHTFYAYTILCIYKPFYLRPVNILLIFNRHTFIICCLYFISPIIDSQLLRSKIS